MRLCAAFLTTLFLGACSSGQPVTAPPPTDKANTVPQVPPTQLVPGQLQLVGTTKDGSWAIYRDATTLSAVPIQVGAAPQVITDKPGTVRIIGSVVFNWADVDWTTNLGDLTVWSPTTGAQHVGITAFADNLVGAAADGSAVVYATDVTDTTVKLVVASTDMAIQQELIAAMGRGGDTTCPASVGFAGQRLFVGWCAVGSRTATIDRYDLANGTWVSTVVSDNALQNWSASATGDRVFYQSGDYKGYYWEAGTSYLIDASVSGGMMVPDGSVVFYNVSDQLRRTTIPDISPIPVVTRGYAQLAEFSPDYTWVMYSTQVTYEGGTKRDLLVVRTDQFNPTPTVLVASPTGSIGRTAFTADNQYAFYFTDLADNGSTLNVFPLNGGQPITTPGVFEATAGVDGKIVFSDTRSDPNAYPVVADLKVLDAATGQITPIEDKVMDGKEYYAVPSSGYVVYVRSGVDRDQTAIDKDGLFLASIP